MQRGRRRWWTGRPERCVRGSRARHRVTLLEKNDWVGGKAAQLTAEGYRFDMGPTILTLPSVLKRVFAEAQKNMDDYLQLIPLDPQWRCFFDDPSQQSRVLDWSPTCHRCEQRLTALPVPRNQVAAMKISLR